MNSPGRPQGEPRRAQPQGGSKGEATGQAPRTVRELVERQAAERPDALYANRAAKAA